MAARFRVSAQTTPLHPHFPPSHPSFSEEKNKKSSVEQEKKEGWGRHVSGDFLPKHFVYIHKCICKKRIDPLLLFVSFDCDSLSEEWGRKQKLGRKISNKCELSEILVSPRDKSQNTNRMLLVQYIVTSNITIANIPHNAYVKEMHFKQYPWWRNNTLKL